MEQYMSLIQIMSCHPLIKEHVSPSVQSILLTFPLSIVTWPLGLCCDPCLLCCCCPCESYYFLSTQIPINLLASILVIFVLLVLLVVAIIVIILVLILSVIAFIILLPFAVEILLVTVVGPLMFYYVYQWIAETLQIS